MGRKRHNRADVIVPYGATPEEKEVNAAWVLARYYNTVVEFMPERKSYKMKTPDFMMMGKAWELKSPHVDINSARRLLRRSASQSDSVVLDCRELDVPEGMILRPLVGWFREHRSVRHLILIVKSNVLEYRK